MTTLVRSGHSHDQDLDGLRARLMERETALGERLAEVDRVKAELAAFKVRYKEQVGRLHEELDELEAAIAEAELGELAKQLAGEDDRPSRSSAAHPEPQARFTTDAVRRLFRDVAKAIHPDLAEDERARDRRHRLMVEANRAYALGDEERLRRILQAWERSPEAVQGSDAESARLRLERRIAEIEEQLTACAGDLAELRDTPIWKLKAMVDEARGRGKDLVGDMVRRLTRDITAARNRLDAMQSHG